MFWRWRCNVNKRTVNFAQQVWTDDNMEAFLKNFVTFKAQLKSRDLIRKERKRGGHDDFGKPMPVLMPASLCKLLQTRLAEAHGDFFQQHFGDMPVHRLAQTPLAVFAENCGLDTGDHVQISRVQARLFDQKWLDSLDSLTATKAQQEPTMDTLRNYKGVRFWKYTLDMTDDLSPQPSGVRSHLSRNAFEQISARLFLESFKRGPFEQGAGSASDGEGTVAQRVDDAPPEIPCTSKTACASSKTTAFCASPGRA